MRLTARHLYHLFQPSQCELRVWLKVQGEVEAEPSEYHKILQELGARHEQRHLATLGEVVDLSQGTFEERVARTVEAIRAGAQVLYQPVFMAGHTLDGAACELLGIPDFLIRGADGYVIRDCKISRHADEEQQAADEEEAEQSGLPDAWIHDGKGWALIVESKIKSPLEREQLERHRRVAIRREFPNPRLLALVVERPKRFSLDCLSVIEWRELYSWLQREGRSPWARRMREYMEILERKLAAEEYLQEGTLTVFAGIPFDSGNPYNYAEAKRLLKLAMEELRKRRDLQRELGVDPEGKGRPAITGREARWIWDFLPLVQARRAKLFTEYPHFTLSIEQDWTYAHITIPNGIKKEYRDNLLSRGKEGFFQLLRQVTTNFEKRLGRVEGASPWISVFQRHYPSQRAEPIVDADIGFDLRTAFPVSETRAASVKNQPQWLEAVYAALSKKRSNLQMAVGVSFDHNWGDATKSRDILDHIANTWLACKPLIRTLVGR